MALPQPNRLRHWRDFQAVYQKGMRRTGRYLTLRCLPCKTSAPHYQTQEITHPLKEDNPPTRIGISINQKVSKKAVVRNRIKRQIKASFRQLLPIISPGWKLVVVVRQGAQECEYAQFLRELKQLLAEAEVINGN